VKGILLYIFIFVNILFAGTFAGNVNDDIDANISMNIDSTVAVEPIESQENFQEFDGDTKIISNDAGLDDYVELNVSNSSSVRQLMDQYSKRSSSQANAIIKKMSEKSVDFSRYSKEDLKDITSDKISSIYTDEKNIQNIQKSKDTITNLLNNYGSKLTIKCYMKRKLVPSFYCPLPGRDASYFTGGLANTTQEDAFNECNDYCQIPKNCVSSDIDSFPSKDITTTYDMPIPYENNLEISEKQQAEKVSFVFTKNGEDCFVNISIYGIDKTTNEERLILDSFSIHLVEDAASVSLPLDLGSFSSIHYKIYKPYNFGTSKKDFVISSASVVLEKAIVSYSDNKYWFCPATQFVSRRDECQGTVLSKIIGGSPVLLCVKVSDKKREPLLGAYFSQGGCEASCFDKRDCIATYRNVSSDSISDSSIYNLDYGCLSGDDNANCTRDLCKEKIMSNTTPNSEIVYLNDVEKEETVKNGQIVDGAIRPQYNLSAELSTNDTPEDKKVLMVSMAKDKAYQNMTTLGTYVISAKTLDGVYDEKTSAKKVGYNGVTIEYIPKSNLFNIGKSSYVYFITANKYTYFSQEEFSTSTYHATNYTIVEGDKDLKLFLVSDMDQVYNDLDARYYESPNKIVLEKTIDSDGKLVSYDVNSYAPYTIKKEFTNDQYRFYYNLSDAYLEYANSKNGTALKNQINEKGHVTKIYSGASGEHGGVLNDYDVYMITSSERLTYKEIINKIQDDTLLKVFSLSHPSGFDREITGHVSAKFEDKNIKIFILGAKDNLTVVGEIDPTFDEIGKDAYIFNFLYQEN